MVLAENDRWLRRLVLSRLRDPNVFWEKMRVLTTARGTLPPSVQGLLLQP